MRLIGCLLLLLLGVGWLASEIELTAAPAMAHRDTDWRRTRNGWERQSSWLDDQPTREPVLHPTLVGVLQILLSVAALIALPSLHGWHLRPTPAERPGTRLHRTSRNGPHRFIQYDAR